MTGEDFVSLARKMMVVHRGSAPAMRSVVSRAYYGVFHQARALLEDLHFHCPRDENSHRFALVYLTNADEKSATDLAALLGTLHEQRKHADYDLDDSRYETEGFAANAIARVDRAMRLLDVCSREPVRTSIRDGIVSYRAKIYGDPGA